jgi:Domain of unknown function (DUF4832)
MILRGKYHFVAGLAAIAAILGFEEQADAATNTYSLAYSAVTSNPLKGFMPYTGSYTTFPYSMEWSYLPLRSLMSGPTNFDWSSLDNLLSTDASRGHQTVFRVYLDYPTLPTGIPQYLLDDGLATYSYDDYDNEGISVCPDYSNALLQVALTNFIGALGARYDGDPRIGFITVGLLGFWGEWHTYPHTNWFASVTVQNEVLTAYGLAFSKTKLLVRWPSGTNPPSRLIGYHDDSFSYETIDPPSYMFLGLLKAAGETNKWMTQPIGGEVYPPEQLCMWDATQTNCVPQGQAFSNCVAQTHASWMLNQGAFDPGFTGSEQALALAGSKSLGYELYVSSAVILDAAVSGPLNVTLQMTNTGVAPFYYDWPVLLGALDSSNHLIKTWPTSWRLSTVLPAQTSTSWSWSQPNHGLAAGQYKLLLGAQNTMTNGMPISFADTAQNADLAGWLTLGIFSVLQDAAPPTLSAKHTTSGLELDVINASPGEWIVENSSNLAVWNPLLTTNTSTTVWSVTNVITSLSQFYRVVSQP